MQLYFAVVILIFSGPQDLIIRRMKGQQIFAYKNYSICLSVVSPSFLPYGSSSCHVSPTLHPIYTRVNADEVSMILLQGKFQGN